MGKQDSHVILRHQHRTQPALQDFTRSDLFESPLFVKQNGMIEVRHREFDVIEIFDSEIFVGRHGDENA